MIKLRNLRKEYISKESRILALDDVSLDVKKGEIFGVIGLSGAGKSTLIRTVNRLEEPTSGDIFIDGIDLLSLKPRLLNNKRKQIGMIFQHFNLLESELKRARNQLTERKDIDRAKGIIMRRRGVSEEVAYQSMRKLAMDTNQKLSQVARSIIQAATILGK